MGLDDFTRSYHLRTVCEVTREIYDLISEHRAQLGEVLYAAMFAKLAEQMRMQKKIDLRLKHYRSNYEEEVYKRNEDYREDEARRAV